MRELNAVKVVKKPRPSFINVLQQNRLLKIAPSAFTLTFHLWFDSKTLTLFPKLFTSWTIQKHRLEQHVPDSNLPCWTLWKTLLKNYLCTFYMCLFSLLFIHAPRKSQVAWAPNKQQWLIKIIKAESLMGTSSLTESFWNSAAKEKWLRLLRCLQYPYL